MSYTYTQLYHMSFKTPSQLLSLIENKELPDHLLTYAAEFSGNVPPELVDRAIRLLQPLLQHTSITVREGAVSGLIDLSDSAPDVHDFLDSAAADEQQHQIIRELCKKP